MRDDTPIPTLSRTDVPLMDRALRSIEMTFRTLTSTGRAKVTFLNLHGYNVSEILSVKALQGDIAFAVNGRKNGEGAGNGTGVLVFFDGSNWIACDSGQIVSD